MRMRSRAMKWKLLYSCITLTWIVILPMFITASVQAERTERIPIEVFLVAFLDDPLSFEASVEPSVEEMVHLFTTRDFARGVDNINNQLSVRFKNVTDSTVTAVEQGVIYYSVFNEHLRTEACTWIGTLKPGDTSETLGTIMSFRGDESVLTVITFTSRVRFNDGTIWQRDPAQITAEVSQRTGSLFKPGHLARTDVPADAGRE